MELKKLRETFRKSLGKEKTVRYVLLLGICGVALLSLSSFWGSGKEKEKAPVQKELSVTRTEKELEQELARVVRAITGEEAPTVLVTFENTGRLLYAADQRKNTQKSQRDGETQTGEETETEHVILKDEQGAQHALTVTEIQPKVKGVVIVSRCARDPAIREKLTGAVRTALDISSARVCVTDSG